MSTSAPVPGQFFALSGLGLPTSQAQYMALWTQSMQAAFGAGWVANPASLEYIQASVFASWAADVAQLASAGSTELFYQFGTQLLSLPPQQGTPALAIVTVTAADTAGYTLPLGTQMTLTLAGTQVGFQTTSVLTIPAGSSTATVTVAAVLPGTGFNGAGSPVALVSQINWVSSVSLVTVASGGVDQEDPDAYVQRLAANLQSLGLATATAAALATRALDFTPTVGTDQQEVGRSTAIDGYSPSAATFTITTTSASPNVTVTTPPGTGITAAPGAAISGTDLPSATFTATTANASPTLTAVSSFANVSEGALLSGTGIPAGTMVQSYNATAQTITLTANCTATGTGITVTTSTAIVLSATATSIVLSANATASGTGIAATVGGTLGNQRTVTDCVTDASGNALNADTRTAVAAYLQTFRELGFVINVVSPAYSTVYVAVNVAASPGYASATVQANVQAALLAYLSPANFGLPQGAIQGWQNTQTVYLSRLAAVIQGTLGVDHIHPATLAVGLAASPTNTTSDLVLPGAFPLPLSTTTSIPASAITVS